MNARRPYEPPTMVRLEASDPRVVQFQAELAGDVAQMRKLVVLVLALCGEPVPKRVVLRMVAARAGQASRRAIAHALTLTLRDGVVVCERRARGRVYRLGAA